MKSENEFLVALYSFLPFGPTRTKLLLDYFGSAKSAWMAEKKQLLEINLSEKIVEKFIEYREHFSDKYFDQLKEKKIQFTTFSDKDYPKNLLEIADFPPVLYYKGTISDNDVNAIAIIGSRKMTTYGKEIASKFSAELASRGVTIVSGLALGIDAAAHQSAVDAGGRTIAAIASGLDNITPATNRSLAQNFLKSGQGVVISEFPLGHQPQKHDFAIRNRIISGLSKAVVVIEGESKSGTLLTASHAAAQGKQVFAVPGQITSPMSGAPHFLLKNGAHLASSVDDILEELDMQLRVDRAAVNQLMPADETEKSIIEILTNEPLHLDEIVRLSGLNTSEVMSKLTMMQLKGLIRELGDGIYQKN